MPVERIKQFLEENQVPYGVSAHPEAFTAQEVAAAVHVPGRHFAKVVAVKRDGELALVALPATDQVDLERLARSLGTSSVELASEAEFREHFPHCEVGAMPPFGRLFGMETFISHHLTQSEEIAFNAGTHTEVMHLRYRDFQRLVEPITVAL